MHTPPSIQRSLSALFMLSALAAPAAAGADHANPAAAPAATAPPVAAGAAWSERDYRFEGAANGVIGADGRSIVPAAQSTRIDAPPDSAAHRLAPYRSPPPAPPLSGGAAELAAIGQAAQEVVDDIIRGTLYSIEVMTGPDARRPLRVEPAVAPGASCEAMYAEVSRLLPSAQSTRPDFQDDPLNATLVAAGTVFTPAFYLLGATEYARHAEQRHTLGVAAQIEILRARMAAQNCFVR